MRKILFGVLAGVVTVLGLETGQVHAGSVSSPAAAVCGVEANPGQLAFSACKGPYCSYSQACRMANYLAKCGYCTKIVCCNGDYYVYSR